MIFVGGLEANFESYYDKSAVAWWQCNWQFSSGTMGMRGWQCAPSQIVICEDCRRVDPLWDGAVRDRDFDDAIDRGMWFLSHEIAHQNIYEETQKRDAWVTAVHENQYAFDLCYAFDIVENKFCKKLYTKEKVMGDKAPIDLTLEECRKAIEGKDKAKAKKRKKRADSKKANSSNQ